MRFEIKWAIFILVGIALITKTVFFALGVQASLLTPMPSKPAESAAYIQGLIQKEQVSPGRPVRLTIPTIKVDVALSYVGLKADGTIGTPEGPVGAAWFYPGTIPGRVGSAVIDGHYGWRDGIKAAFDDISKLKKGDKIYVEDQKGLTSAFVVTSSRVYPEDEDTSDVFNSSDGIAHLNLITCGGIWNKTTHLYSDRLVVFSDKEL